MSDHDKTFKAKLDKMTNSQQSIQSLSLWVMYHAKRYKESIDIWKREILKAKSSRKILYLYLANDIMQNSRKKTQDFIKGFSEVLPEVIDKIWSKDKRSITRMFRIWEDRKVYSSSFIKTLFKKTQEKDSFNIHGTMHGILGSFESFGGLGGLGSMSGADMFIQLQDHPVVKALLQLEQTHGQQNAIQKETTVNVLEKIKDEKALANLSLDELQEIQHEYTLHLKKFSELRHVLEVEHEKRNQLLQALKEEVKRQSEVQTKLETEIQQWSTTIEAIQKFMTQIEIKVNSKKMENTYDYFKHDQSTTETNSSSQLVTSSGGTSGDSAGGHTGDPSKKRSINDTMSSNSLINFENTEMENPGISGYFSQSKKQKIGNEKEQEKIDTMQVPDLLMHNPPAVDVNTILNALSSEQQGGTLDSNGQNQNTQNNSIDNILSHSYYGSSL